MANTKERQSPRITETLKRRRLWLREKKDASKRHSLFQSFLGALFSLNISETQDFLNAIKKSKS